MKTNSARHFLLGLALAATVTLCRAQEPAAANPFKPSPELRLISLEIDQALRNKDWDKVNAKLAKAEELLPEGQREVLDLVRFKVLLGRKEYPAAYQLGRRLGDANPTNVVLLNEMAWNIVADPGIEDRDLALAETLSTRANEAAKTKPVLTRLGVLDTLARVRFLQGRKEEAVALEEKALALASEADKMAATDRGTTARGEKTPALAPGAIASVIQKALDSYRKGELPKAP